MTSAFYTRERSSRTVNSVEKIYVGYPESFVRLFLKSFSQAFSFKKFQTKIQSPCCETCIVTNIIEASEEIVKLHTSWRSNDMVDEPQTREKRRRRIENKASLAFRRFPDLFGPLLRPKYWVHRPYHTNRPTD